MYTAWPPSTRCCGGCSLEAKRVQGPEHQRMTAAPKYFPRRNCIAGVVLACLACPQDAEAEVSREVTGHVTEGTRRGIGPSTCTRIAENNVGKVTNSSTGWQQPAKTTRTSESEAEWRSWDWRMSPYELRRGGNAPRGDARHHHRRGYTSPVQRGSRRLAGTVDGYREGHRSRQPVACRCAKPLIKPDAQECMHARALALAQQRRVNALCRGRQPDSGNPTVRDDNGGSEKRDLWWNCEPTRHTERVEMETLRLSMRALRFYPNSPERPLGSP